MLATLLAGRKDAILAAWRRRIAETYPPATAGMLLKGGDPFANPVGHAIAEAAEGMLEWVLAGEGVPPDADPPLEDLVRIRAVQAFTPSKAMAFVFSLKGILREQLKGSLEDPARVPELLRLESRIDALALAAFDAYMACREEIARLRVEDVKRRMGRAPGPARPCPGTVGAGNAP